MTTTTDLSPERLDELEEAWRHIQWPTAAIRDEMHNLIAMARGKQRAERERDDWKAKFEAVRQSESNALAENDALVFIARTNGFQRDKAERERDALRAVALEVWGFLEIDRCAPDCAWRKEVRERLAAVAQPTLPTGAASRDAGGDAS